ncbi:putative phosphatase [Methanolobus tindarius DSM 2278]|jgi:phosphoglycolate phosphatase-like HAD superfamily hydrolase|uniref:Putative phosphatase n=1 Tax=Methanolobus tindarius DSM 2278 TaxID=1090322 RepID=W9DN79_METTI|nr:HAD hydrolase-like protein [Methanolobus tindarius]ETA67449.1 putative phosphatase [Methanolobus tindarius DSM 2278]
MSLNRKFPILILDFDGVILESVDVKTEAFRQLFSFSPDNVDKVVSFHVENGGMSRFDKIRYIYDNILCKSLHHDKYEYLCNRFSELVLNGVLTSNYVNGGKEFLEFFSKCTSLFLVSATPISELMHILTQRGLLDYFEGIYGAPRPKTECIEEILCLSECSEKDSIFVGDALNDYNAAKMAGVRFIGRVKPGGINIFKDKGDVETVVPDLEELKKYLEGLYC